MDHGPRGKEKQQGDPVPSERPQRRYNDTEFFIECRFHVESIKIHRFRKKRNYSKWHFVFHKIMSIFSEYSIRLYAFVQQ